MAGPVVAGDLPLLLPTPTTTAATSCVSLRPPPAPYTSKKPTAMVVVAGRLPPLLPTPTKPPPAQHPSKKPADRASLSESWVKDKITGGGVPSDRSQDSGGGGGGGSADGNGGKMPGRASLSSSWVEDKLLGSAGTSTSGVERASRPTWRDGWNGSKRAASRAPSADRSEKKAKPPTDNDEEEEDNDALESETQQYAGPTFVLSPDPSELPIPVFFLKAH